MKTGIVMEGGAMRGMFTCGVLDVLMEEGITFDGAVGVSAGATFGCNLKSGQIGRALRYNKKYCTDKRYHSISSLITTGDIYNVDFCYEELPYKLDKWDVDSFASNPMEFYCVATDAVTGKPVYYKCEKAIGRTSSGYRRQHPCLWYQDLLRLMAACILMVAFQIQFLSNSWRKRATTRFL